MQRSLIAAAIAALSSTTSLAQNVADAPRADVPGVQTEARRRGVDGWATEASFETRVTATNNANFGDSSERQGDVILEFTPQLRFNRQGGRLRVDGAVALDMIGYLDGTQVSRILPRANVFANLEAIDDLFFIDASLNVDQQVENPFQASGASSTNNLYTSTQTRVAPYLTGRYGPNWRWLLRSDNSYTWTNQSSTPLSNAYYVRNLAEVVRAPTPLGLTVRLTNDVTTYDDDLQPDQTLNVALAILDYAFTPQFRFGLRAGYEDTNYTFTDTSGPIYGANLTWRPSPLTSIDGYWESRFYGPSYQYSITNRQRRLATSIGGFRTISTYPQLLLQLQPTPSTTALLDFVLRSRFPDPIERMQQAQDLIARQGLPESLPRGALIYNQSINILTGANAAWALIGARNTLALNLFYLKTESLPDAQLPATFITVNDTVQRGAAVSLSHLLTPVVSLNGTVTARTIRGLDANAGRSTDEGAVTLQANWQASPRSTVFVGARYRRQDDTGTVQTTSDSTEAAVYVGLFHRL
jgi:uncharacterized protein (PEP-CTERM system associated)